MAGDIIGRSISFDKPGENAMTAAGAEIQSLHGSISIFNMRLISSAERQ
jgi:hypothetical protein